MTLRYDSSSASSSVKCISFNKPKNVSLWAKFYLIITAQGSHDIARRMRIISAFGVRNQFLQLQFCGYKFCCFFFRIFHLFSGKLVGQSVFLHRRYVSHVGRSINNTPSRSELRELVTDDNNSLTVILKNLTTTLGQLSEASQAQTAALADLKEDLLLQDDAAEPNLDRPVDSLDITQITAVLNDFTCNSGANTTSTNNMASDIHSDSEFQGHTNIVGSLTQAYLPNAKTSPAIEGKIATLIDNMLTGGLSTDTVKHSTEKYSPPENVKRLNVTSVNEEVWDLLPHWSRMVDLAFQKVQEFLLPGLSVPCTLDSIALLCNTHHKLNTKRQKLIKPALHVTLQGRD